MRRYITLFAGMLILSLSDIYCQTSLPSFIVSITQTPSTSINSFEFEVNIKNLDTSFVLTSYQCSFRIYPEFHQTDSVTFSYINGTSQLSNAPGFAIGTNNSDGYIEFAFASFAGCDTITTSGCRIGTFKLDYLSLPTNNHYIEWNFEGNSKTIFTNHFYVDITPNGNFLNSPVLTNEDNDLNIINSYNLEQNYPNPFNPSTFIEFNLPQKSQVKLTVFNVLGKQIAELINGRLGKGIHIIEFNSSDFGDLASGIYFYTIQIGDSFVDTKKMLLLK